MDGSSLRRLWRYVVSTVHFDHATYLIKGLPIPGNTGMNCGGSLISPRLVASAFHCAVWYDDPDRVSSYTRNKII